MQVLGGKPIVCAFGNEPRARRHGKGLDRTPLYLWDGAQGLIE
jgi:hypothetical protein